MSDYYKFVRAIQKCIGTDNLSDVMGLYHVGEARNKQLFLCHGCMGTGYSNTTQSEVHFEHAPDCAYVFVQSVIEQVNKLEYHTPALAVLPDVGADGRLLQCPSAKKGGKNV